MPPRFAYWTILIDNTPTAFRAHDAQELLPTAAQLKRTNQNVVLKWFSGGQLWDSPEAAQEARRKPKVMEKRGADWRPGGQHRDPRARFDKKKKPTFDRRDRPPSAHSLKGAGENDRDRGSQPFRADGQQRGRKPFKSFKPAGAGSARKPWGPKPGGDRKPWGSKPGGERKPWGAKSGGERKPWGAKPGGERKPWGAKPGGERKPWGGSPGGGARKPWHGAKRSGDRPFFGKAFAPKTHGGPPHHERPRHEPPRDESPETPPQPRKTWRAPGEHSNQPRDARGPRKRRDDE
jgi:hypothetical protein